MSSDWKRATLGDAVAAGHAITVWCDNRGCGYWQKHGQQYRVVLPTWPAMQSAMVRPCPSVLD
jgi:hypothetical protein